MPIETFITEITPAIALTLLERNTANRPLDKRRAARLAEEIKRGRWMLNGDAIRVSSDGVLLDGQHRLTAIAMSGMAVPSLVVNGLPPETFKTIDQDRRGRTAADVLAIEGVKNYTIVAAIARLVHKYEKCGNPFNGSPENVPSTQESEALALRSGITTAANRTAGRKWCKKFVTPSICGFCDYVFTERYPDFAGEFMLRLETGSGLDAGSPILLLRERLMGASGDKEAMRQSYKTALIFKAFRLFVDGAKIKTLRVRTGGEAPEKDLFIL